MSVFDIFWITLSIVGWVVIIGIIGIVWMTILATIDILWRREEKPTKACICDNTTLDDLFWRADD